MDCGHDGLIFTLQRNPAEGAWESLHSKNGDVKNEPKMYGKPMTFTENGALFCEKCGNLSNYNTFTNESSSESLMS
jgi:hypothetical protein